MPAALAFWCITLQPWHLWSWASTEDAWPYLEWPPRYALLSVFLFWESKRSRILTSSGQICDSTLVGGAMLTMNEDAFAKDMLSTH